MAFCCRLPSSSSALPRLCSAPRRALASVSSSSSHGVQVVSIDHKGPQSAVHLILKAGPRFESSENVGVAHHVKNSVLKVRFDFLWISVPCYSSCIWDSKGLLWPWILGSFEIIQKWGVWWKVSIQCRGVDVDADASLDGDNDNYAESPLSAHKDSTFPCAGRLMSTWKEHPTLVLNRMEPQINEQQTQLDKS